MKTTLIGSIDRITEHTAYLILNDDEHELQFPVDILPNGTDEGMAFTITIQRNLQEEERLRQEIAALRDELAKKQ